MRLLVALALAACELTPPLHTNLERCLWSLVSYRVGIRGTFLIHVKTTADGRFTYSVEGEPWRDAPGNACISVAHERPSCGWSAIGPFRGWRIKPE